MSRKVKGFVFEASFRGGSDKSIRGREELLRTLESVTTSLWANTCERLEFRRATRQEIQDLRRMRCLCDALSLHQRGFNSSWAPIVPMNHWSMNRYFERTKAALSGGTQP